MQDILKTLWSGGAALGITGVMSPVVGLLSIPDPARSDGAIRLWARSLLATAGVRHEAEGLERLPGGHCVLVCNHQSHYDVPLIFAHVPKHLRYVAKMELSRIPVFGQALRLTGNIFVERSGSQQDRQRLEEAVKAVRERVSVMFFAEGTRSPDGTLRPFKKGAATMAIQAQVPLVPMAVSGTRHILPKGGRSVRWGQKVALVVGESLSTRGLTLENRTELTRRLQAAVAQLYERARERSGDMG
jgi:1-acyl-sn-glycerol-3-phosphate acyltransferase